MRIRYIQAIFFQALAPVSFLLFSMFVIKQAGVSGQGAFASVKSWVDVLIVAGCFGFPQSSILAINKEGASARWMYKATSIYAAVLVPVFVVGSMIFQEEVAINTAAALCIGFGAAAAVLANIWRGVLLTIDDGVRFHLITILPTFSLIVSSSIGLLLGYEIDGHTAYFYGATTLMLLPAAYFLFPWRKVAHTVGEKPSLKRMLTNGSDVFIQALANVLQTYVCLWFLRHSYDLTQAGYFSLSLLLVNSLGFPLQAISPMILNRWSKISGGASLRVGGKEINLFLLLALAAIICISIFMRIFPLENFIGGTAQLAASMSIAIFILVPNISSRVDSLRLASVGKLRLNSFVAASRCLLFAVMLGLVHHSVRNESGASIAMICWLIAEVFAALFLRLCVVKAQTEY